MRKNSAKSETVVIDKNLVDSIREAIMECREDITNELVLHGPIGLLDLGDQGILLAMGDDLFRLQIEPVEVNLTGSTPVNPNKDGDAGDVEGE